VSVIDADTREDFSVRASFRVWGPAPNSQPPRLGVLNPHELTALLGILPSSAHKQGDLPQNNPNEGFTWAQEPWSAGMWEVNSDYRVHSRNLVDHLIWLLDLLDSVKDQLREYIDRNDLEADFFCLIQVEDYTGLRLQPEVLKRLTAINVPLGVEIYS